MKKQFFFTTLLLLVFSIGNAQSNNKKKYKTETNKNIRTLTCQYCAKKFKQEKSILSTMMGDVEIWSGGADHCDPNWESRRENNLKVNLLCISKYCSRKCACDTGEE